jgi:hypothetical protein
LIVFNTTGDDVNVSVANEISDKSVTIEEDEIDNIDDSVVEAADDEAETYRG